MRLIVRSRRQSSKVPSFEAAPRPSSLSVGRGTQRNTGPRRSNDGRVMTAKTSALRGSGSDILRIKCLQDVYVFGQ